MRGVMWTIRKEKEKCLENLEMWLWRRMENIKWSDTVRNEEVRRRVREERSTWNSVKKRKTSWIGCTLRRHCTIRNFMDGKLEGKWEGRELECWMI